MTNLSCTQAQQTTKDSDDSLLRLAEQRRSVRQYTDEPVNRETIDKILTVAALAPSSYGQNPVEFVVVEGREQLSELANYTGRSLATFKRDFAKVSSLSPEKWLLNRRLEAAYDLLSKGKGNIGVTDAAYKVGFKNRSHFTKSFKEHFGKSPSEVGNK